jgi:hypothetical protein
MRHLVNWPVVGGPGADLRAEFKAHRKLIEALASEQFDQKSTMETGLVRIFAKLGRVQFWPSMRRCVRVKLGPKKVNKSST